MCSGALNAMEGDGFEYSLRPPDSGFSIFSADRTKKIHFIRHAEGYHNVATKETGSNDCLLRGDEPAAAHHLYDSRLTAKGMLRREHCDHILLHGHQAQDPSPLLIWSLCLH